MRGIAAIGLAFGVVMMTAPLWLPRLGVGGSALGFGAPQVAQAMPQHADVPPVTRPGAEGVPGAGISAMLAAARGMFAAGLPAGRMNSAGSPDEAAAAICAAASAGGARTKADCHAQVSATFDPEEQKKMMGDVERAMQGDRPAVRIGTPARNPGAKFVKVEK